MNEEKLIEKVREAYSPSDLSDLEKAQYEIGELHDEIHQLEFDLAHQRKLVRVLAEVPLFPISMSSGCCLKNPDELIAWAEARVVKQEKEVKP